MRQLTAVWEFVVDTVSDLILPALFRIGSLDCWNPTARSQQTLFCRNGLAGGSHLLKLVARGAQNPYAADSRLFVDAVQFSSATGAYHYPTGTGPRGPQRMIFGYTGREDYRDAQGNTWRPATEWVTRLASGADPVGACWWTTPAPEAIEGTADPELYRYGVHARDFWVNLTVGPGRYYARLKFAATRGFDSRMNPFDLRINGERRVARLDVSATAGGPQRAVDLRGKGFGVAPEDSAGLVLIELDGEGKVRQRHDKDEVKTARWPRTVTMNRVGSSADHQPSTHRPSTGSWGARGQASGRPEGPRRHSSSDLRLAADV